MKIYTRVEYAWDAKANKYVLLDSESFEYFGPIATCTGAEAVPVAAETAGGKAAADAVAGDAFLPGALGADGLGAVGAAGSGLAGDAFLPAALGSEGAGLGAEAIAAPLATGAEVVGTPLIDSGVTSLANTGTAGDTLAGQSAFKGAADGATPALSNAVPTGAGVPDAPVGDVLNAGAPASATTPAAAPNPLADTMAGQGEGIGAGNNGVTGGVQTTGVTTPAQPTDWLSKGLSAIKGIKPTDALTAAGLGYNMYSQQQAKKAMGDMQGKIANAVKPLETTQGQLLEQYNSGTLTASDAQGIQDYITHSKAQIRQQYAAMGQANSPQQAQAEAAVEQKAAAMTDQALKNYLTEALQTTGAITGPYAAIANQQIAADTGLQNAAKSVFSAIGAQQSGRPA